MKKIGRGWQYTTYDLEKGRVLKKYNSKLVGYIHIFKVCFPFKTNPVWKIPAYYRGCKETARDSLIKVKNSTLESWMTGNFKALNELDYEQDKVTPIHVALSTANDEEAKKIINEFVLFNKILVEKSIIDKSFNITQNFALDKNGRVILMDIGEVFTNKDSIEKQINNRAWSKHYVVNPIPPQFRDYFVTKMDQEFKTP